MTFDELYLHVTGMYYYIVHRVSAVCYAGPGSLHVPYSDHHVAIALTPHSRASCWQKL